MGMFVEKENDRIKVIIPNSEATIDAQHKGIKDSEVTGFYTSDKEENKQQILDFLGENLEYFLDVRKVVELINSIKQDFYIDYKEIYKDNFSSLESSLDFFEKLQKNYIKIPKMYYSGQNDRYLKFENGDPIVKQLRAILYGDITGFYIIKNDNYYLISPFVLENAREILDKRKEKVLERENDSKEMNNEWLYASSRKETDEELNNTGRIDWETNNAKIKVGDRVYIYKTSPEQRISTVLEVEKVDDSVDLEGNKKHLMVMTKIKDVNDERLSLNELTKHGLNGAPQVFCSVSSELSKYIHSIIGVYLKENFLSEVFITGDKYDSIVSILDKKKNIILEGAPGVGKTFMAKRLAYSIIGKEDIDKVKLIQFHQSYSYEDFIEGFRPVENGFVLKKGLFRELCDKALKNPKENYYIIIDEINRGNLSKIFGELLMLIEADKRGDKLTLPYSEEEFSVPSNLYIIGLMNTADRSLALIDYALRRRFSFIRIEPAFENDKFIASFKSKFNGEFDNVIEIIKEINKAIEEDKSLGAGFKIGHSYFCPDLKGRNGTKKDIEEIITYEIVPLLEEYWYDDEDSLVQWKDTLNGAINE